LILLVYLSLGFDSKVDRPRENLNERDLIPLVVYIHNIKRLKHILSLLSLLGDY